MFLSRARPYPYAVIDVPDIQTVIDVFLAKGVLRADELRRARARVEDSLKPSTFLTAVELDAVTAVVDALELPAPTGWSHALYLHGLRTAQATYSPHRVYGPVSLYNLATLLHKAGFQNPRVFRKLEAAARKAERYGVGHVR
jgi:hypothetical protein